MLPERYIRFGYFQVSIFVLIRSNNLFIDILRKFLTIDLNRPKNEQEISIIYELFNSDHENYQIDSLMNYYQPLIEWLQEWKQKRNTF